MTRIEYEEYEHVTCLKYVDLICEGTVSGKKGYLAVSTTALYGEDIQCKGKVSMCSTGIYLGCLYILYLYIICQVLGVK